ncbi:MAG: hypothetical protein U1E77_19975 [Inhella sp.]
MAAHRTRRALAEASASLLSAGAEAQRADGESLDELLARLSVRLGKEQVRQARPVPTTGPNASSAGSLGRTHRSGAQQARPEAPAQWPQPSWLLNPPQPLRALGEQPLYQGPLTLLAGPQRIEAGWWDTEAPACSRDYYLAHSARAGLLWLFRERRAARGEAAWFLHGMFA